MPTLHEAKAAVARARAALDGVAEKGLLEPGDVATLRADVHEFDEALKNITDAPNRVLEILADAMDGMELRGSIASAVATMNGVSEKLEALGEEEVR